MPIASRLAILAALALAGSSRSVAAQTLFQVREPTIGCSTPRAAAALSGSDPRRNDPGWVDYVMRDGRCVQITPASRWALVAPGPEMLMRNVVPGDGQTFYIPGHDLLALSRQPAAPPRPPRTAGAGQQKFMVGRIGRANRSLTVQNNPDGSINFSLDEWSDAGNNFSVSGVAQRVGAEWQYRDAMDSSDAAGRCGVDIAARSDNGYDVSTVDGARCEGLAGHNMVLYGVDSFPGSSRTR